MFVLLQAMPAAASRHKKHAVARVYSVALGLSGAIDPVLGSMRNALSAPSSAVNSVADGMRRQIFSARKCVNAVQEEDSRQSFSQAL